MQTCRYRSAIKSLIRPACFFSDRCYYGRNDKQRLCHVFCRLRGIFRNMLVGNHLSRDQSTSLVDTTAILTPICQHPREERQARYNGTIGAKTGGYAET